MVLRRTGVGLSENILMVAVLIFWQWSPGTTIVIVTASLFGIPEYYIVTIGMMAQSTIPPYSKQVLVAVIAFSSVKQEYQIYK